MRQLLMEQAHLVPPTIKANDFYTIIKNLFEETKIEILEPAGGTNPTDILKEHLERLQRKMDYLILLMKLSHT